MSRSSEVVRSSVLLFRVQPDPYIGQIYDPKWLTMTEFYIKTHAKIILINALTLFAVYLITRNLINEYLPLVPNVAVVVASNPEVGPRIVNNIFNLIKNRSEVSTFSFKRSTKDFSDAYEG